MTVRAYLALGSNVGERQANLKQALQALHARPGIAVKAVSAVYETDPVGFVDQPAFLNMAAVIETSLSPLALLEAILQIEAGLGRVRTIRWGPRVIDIDILLYGQERVNQPDLQIPHPAMLERAFVLVPLRDVWREGNTFPFEHKPIDEYIRLTEDYKGVRTWGMLDWATGSGPSAS